MEIKADLCIGCGQCVIVCPVKAIELKDNKAVINQDQCIECGVCYRDAECPVKAIRSTRLKWPRIIRSPFSNVIATHKVTGIPGRGTEEMKTNDVTNRYNYNEVGISIDIGRPGVGTYLRNVELFTTKLSKIGVEYEKDNPVTAIIVDDKGHIKEDLKNEKVLSAMFEFKIPINKISKVLKIIREMDKKIDTVFTVGIITRVMENVDIPIINLLSKEGFNVRPNVKANMGLGRA